MQLIFLPNIELCLLLLCLGSQICKFDILSLPKFFLNATNLTPPDLPLVRGGD
jgi:hypothetical protein